MRFDLNNGKYTYIFEDGNQSALRYGEPWRDLVGDNLILAMAQEIERLRERVSELGEYLADCQRASWED